MIRLGIDLNNVLRNVNVKFYETYCNTRAMRYQISDEKLQNLDVYHDDGFFKFKSRKERMDFLFDNAYDILACAPTMEVNLKGLLNVWLAKVVEYFEDEEVELVALAPSEGGAALSSSMVFLGKGFQFRHVEFPKDSKDCWHFCDAIITANPRIIDYCPADKVVVKIKRKYNAEKPCDMEYDLFGGDDDHSGVLKDEAFLTTLVKTMNNKRKNSIFAKWTKRKTRQLRILRERLQRLTKRK